MADSSPSSASAASRVMEWSRPVIAVFALVIYALSFYLAWLAKDASQQNLSLLTGSIMTIMATIVGYYFGSSSGQQKKDDVIGAIAQTPTPVVVATPASPVPLVPGTAAQATSPSGEAPPAG